MNQAIQKAQDSEAEMKKSERDRMVLSDDLDDARQQAAQLKRDNENLQQQINTLNQSISAFEVNAANKDHELRRVHDRLHDRDRELQHSRTQIESFKQTVALKDDEIARLRESETELHEQIAESDHTLRSLQITHANELKEMKARAQDAEERATQLREEISSLENEKDAEINKAQAVEAELMAMRASQFDVSKKTRLSSNKSPLSNEYGQEETDKGTLIDEQSAAESTDADNDTFVTHTVITRRKQSRKSGVKAGPASVLAEIENSRFFAEVAVQSEPLEHASTLADETVVEPAETKLKQDEIVALPADEPFPSTLLLNTTGRSATPAEAELEKKLLIKWHANLALPIEGLGKGVTDDAASEWAVLRQETGSGCAVIDQLLERSKKTGPRPGSRKAEPPQPIVLVTEKFVSTKDVPSVYTLQSIIRQVITSVYPQYKGELDPYIAMLPAHPLVLNRNTILVLALMLAFLIFSYTFLLLHWAPVLNPAAYYPGVSYRDRALWTAYHQYAYHRRYGPPRMSRTSPLSDPFTRVWCRVVEWVT
ncbi:hypothetical protein DACRYDRAFT_20510, partial [Dacryopinax primogenitus]